MKSVTSSHITHVHEEDGDLFVKFANGSTYRYPGAGGHESRLLSAPSAGSYLRMYVIPRYRAVKVRRD